MYCSYCGSRFIQLDPYCSKCGRPASHHREGKNILDGSHNNNNVIGDYNTVLINHQHHSDSVEESIDYERRRKIKLPFGIKGATVTASTLTIVGIVGFLANIVQILEPFDLKFFVELGLLKNLNIRILLIFCFVFGLLVFSLIKTIKKTRFQRIGLKSLGGRGINIEYDNGRFYLSQINADCPLCDGKVRLITEGNITIGVCNRNPEQHRFEFDHTKIH